MSGPDAPDHNNGTAPDHGPRGVLTADSIDRILTDFRTWLAELTDRPPAPPPVEPISIHALVAQFTALRQDVNLQTKATRTAVEQTHSALGILNARGAESEESRSFIKLILDVYDALGIAHRQLAQASQSTATAIEIPWPPIPARPSFLARLFGAELIDTTIWTERRTAFNDSLAKIQDRLTGAADGYAMSLRRIERNFPQLGLEPIPCRGLPFDPERMEAVDAVSSPEFPSGTVIEVLREGFLLHNRLYRHAQVKVAR